MDGYNNDGEPSYWKKAVFSMMKKFIPRGVARLFTMEGRKKKEGYSLQKEPLKSSSYQDV
jgi:hypothetical protein